MARESSSFELVPLHYYGDVVRGCFVLGTLLIITGALIDSEMLPVYLALGGFGAVVMVVLAGLTSPKMKAVLFIEMAVAATIFLFFQYAALGHYLA
jgi:hypothetical protein